MLTSFDKVKVAVWNAEWAKGSSPRGLKIASILEGLDADIICLTEGSAGLLPETGFTIESDPDYGYPLVPGRRKVLLWSRNPWITVDNVGHPSLPSGRFVRGCTATPIGAITVCGICIPWRGAHVSGGTKDRKPWDDHLSFLKTLRRILEGLQGSTFIMCGDYNQRIPRKWQPIKVFRALETSFDGFAHIATKGVIPGIGTQVIDHIALSPDLETSEIVGIDRHDDEGKNLSDHNGVVVGLTNV